MQNPIEGAGVAHERPAKRDPKSGHLIPHHAYEGWAPAEPREFSSWWLVIGCALIALAAFRGLMHVG